MPASTYSDKTPLGALIKTTLVDFPSRVACALFLTGCNLRCPYCYNGALVTKSETPEHLATFDDVRSHLEKRRAVLSGFVISGGEALLHPALPALIRSAKETGYAVKLDTNGTLPDRLAALIANAATRPDFVSMDIKTSPARYGELAPKATRSERRNAAEERGENARACAVGQTAALDGETSETALSMHGVGASAQAATRCDGASTHATASEKTLSMHGVCASMQAPANYAARLAESASLIAREYAADCREWRTVLVPPLVQKADIAEMARLLPADARWFFAPFRADNCLDSRYNAVAPYSEAEAEELVAYAKTLVAGARLR